MAAPEAKPERPSFVRRAAVSAAGGTSKNTRNVLARFPDILCVMIIRIKDYKNAPHAERQDPYRLPRRRRH